MVQIFTWIQFLIATIGFVTWFYFVWNPLPWLRPVIGMGFGMAWGTWVGRVVAERFIKRAGTYFPPGGMVDSPKDAVVKLYPAGMRTAFASAYAEIEAEKRAVKPCPSCEIRPFGVIYTTDGRHCDDCGRVIGP